MPSRKGTVLGILSSALFLVSFLPLLHLNLLHLTDQWTDNLRIRVFFGAEIPETRAVELKETWDRRPEVAQVTWVGKDQALKALLESDSRTGREGDGSLERLVADLGGNPLPHSVWITLHPPYRTPETVDAFIVRLQASPEVEAVQYDREGLRRLDRLTDGIRGVAIWGGGAMGVALLVLVILTLRAMSSSIFSGIGMGVGSGLLSLVLVGGFYTLLSRTLLQGVETLFFPAAWMGGWVLMGGLLGAIGGFFASLPGKSERGT